MLGPREAVPCLSGCFWGLLWHKLLSISCVQAGGAHQEGEHLLPHGQALALGWESRSGGTGTEGLTVPGAVPSLGAHQLPRVAPTAGTESLPCWQHSSLAEEAAEKMQLQQTTATRASAAIHTWH